MKTRQFFLSKHRVRIICITSAHFWPFYTPLFSCQQMLIYGRPLILLSTYLSNTCMALNIIRFKNCYELISNKISLFPDFIDG